ncbi:MAG: c-type cytochrome [Anaerolineales bacterium]
MKFRATFFIALFSLLLAACYSLAEDVTPPPNYVQSTPAPAMGALYPAAAPDVANGATIYAEKCAPCHGPTGLADGPQAEMLPVAVPALGSPEVANRAAPAAWYAIVTQGNLENFMPGFASLTDQERWDVVAYAHSLSTDPAQIEAGKTIYEANCADCHGPDGNMAANSDFTDLQWLSARSLDDWAVSVRQGKGTMPGFDGLVGDGDVYAALAYARTFAYSDPRAASRAEQPQPDPAPETVTPAEDESDPAAPVETDETPTRSGGQVSGVVTSGSGGALPSGLKVVLFGFDHGADGRFSETLAIEAEVAADGSYLFDNVEMPAGRAFYVLLTYEGVEYASEAAFVQDGQTSFELPIQIYEATSDSSLLEIGQAHVLLEFSTLEKVTVIHFLTIDNLSDKTIVPPAEGHPVVSFRLPQGFENLQFEDGVMGGRFMPTADGFGDQMRVPPGAGQYQLVFAYDLPYTSPSGLGAVFGSGATDLTVPLTLPARAVTVLVPEGVTADGAGFTDVGLQSMGSGMNFQMYRTGSLAAGQDLNFKVSGTPRTLSATGETDNSQVLVIGVASLGIVLIAVGGFLYWRDRRQDVDALEEDEESLEEEEDADDEPDMDEDEILDAILALDDQFKAGNIAESVYRERRAELKAKLSGRR